MILADAPALEVLNVQNNSLTGNVPPGNVLLPMANRLIALFVLCTSLFEKF